MLWMQFGGTPAEDQTSMREDYAEAETQSGRQAVILSPAGVGGCPPPVIAPRLEPVCGCNLVKGKTHSEPTQNLKYMA
jgi:hypothetical protein